MFVLFIASYVVLRRIQEIKAEEDRHELASAISESVTTSLQPLLGKLGTTTTYDRFNELPWQDLISSSSQIHIVVHYLDTWMHNWAEPLKQLFARGRQVRQILPTFENAALVEQVSNRFPEYSSSQVRDKIESTFRKLVLLKDKSNHLTASVEVYYVDFMVWYCGIRFDYSELVLSPFEHNREVCVSAPATLVSLDEYQGIHTWLEGELSKLVRDALGQTADATLKPIATAPSTG